MVLLHSFCFRVVVEAVGSQDHGSATVGSSPSFVALWCSLKISHPPILAGEVEHVFALVGQYDSSLQGATRT